MRAVGEFFSEAIDTNEDGGRQGRVEFRLDLADPYAMLALGRTLAEGAVKHAPDNWRRIDASTHVNHALGHIYGHLAGDRDEAHLEHAFCRLMMAVAMAHGEVESAGTPDNPVRW